MRAETQKELDEKQVVKKVFCPMLQKEIPITECAYCILVCKV